MPSVHTNSSAKWSVVFASCVINFLLDGVGRLIGIFFVASMEEFPGVGRQVAALPYSLGTAIRNLSGPLAGLLAKQYGIRNVTLCGAVLSALSIGLCFFATSILWIIVLWGGVFGIGYSLGNTLLPVAITEAFEKNQATATGISFSGGCFGSLCLPSIFYYVLDHYGFRGLFLITGALVLHCIPASLLLHRSSRSSESHLSKSNKTAKSENMAAYWNPEIDSVSSSGMYEDADSCSVTGVPVSQKTVTSVKSLASDKTVSDEGAINNKGCNGNLTKKPLVLRVSVIECTFTYDSRFPSVPNGAEDHTTQRSAYRSRSVPVGFYDNSIVICDDGEICESNNLPPSPLPLNENRINKLENGECISVPETSKSLRVSTQETLDVAETDGTNQSKNKVLHSLRVFGDQRFLIVALSMATYEFVFIAVITVIIDFSKDLQVAQDNTKWIFMSFSIGDLFGRLCLGWITDKKVMSRNCFAALCFLGMTATLLGMSISDGFLSLLGCFGVFGVFESSAIIMFPLLMVQSIQPEFHTVAVSSSNLLPGVAALAVPPTIGYFRDEIGSYLGLFYILGAACVVSSILCLILPHVPSRRQSQRCHWSGVA